jgi:hypothetical protein
MLTFALGVVVAVCIGLGVYLIVARLLKTEELTSLIKAFKGS